MFVRIHRPLTGEARRRFMGLYGLDPQGEFFKFMVATSTESGEVSIDAQSPSTSDPIITLNFRSVPPAALRHFKGLDGEKRRQQLLNLADASMEIEPPALRPTWATKKSDRETA